MATPHQNLPPSSPNPTFLFVPGHWHTHAHLGPLLSKLHTRQHRTRSVQLHSVGLKPSSPRPCFSDDVSVIYTAVCQELLRERDVCLVLHGYAGVPGAEAVNRLVVDGVVPVKPEVSVGGSAGGWLNVKEEGAEDALYVESESRRGSVAAPTPSGLKARVVRVVFICALIAPAGVPVDQKKFVGPENPGISIDDKNMVHMSSPWHHFFNDLLLSAAKPFVDAVAPTYYVGPAHLTSERWRTAPCTALLCRKDNALSLLRQEAMWKWSEVACQWMDACHSPFVSRPEEVATFLEGVIR